ncbi:MAG: hypothetical protein H8F28_06150, partial [Fibrella sp.]|nr:hypothetical protein [Armatimonadota bacterium]
TGLASDAALAVSPNQPLAYLKHALVKGENGLPDTPPSLQVYTTQGLGRVIRLDAGTGPLRWAPDGKSVFATKFFERTPEGKRTSRDSLTLVNLETGIVSHPERLPTVADDKPAPSPYAEWGVAPMITNVTVQTPSGQAQDTTALWLRATGGTSVAGKEATGTVPTIPDSISKAFLADALLVATNARLQGYLVNRNTAAVLFTRDGSLCAAPVFRLSRTAFEQGIRGVQRQVTMSNAKQVGLAILIYSQDYDENYPQPGKGVAKAVRPYIKSEAVFKNPATGEPGFVYTHSGSTALAEMAEPANTQLGYISGPGGRAIIWADGHVTWLDDSTTP